MGYENFLSGCATHECASECDLLLACLGAASLACENCLEAFCDTELMDCAIN
jgi:hypothetical protein